MPGPQDGGPTRPRVVGFRILDLAGLVVGYGLAALLARSFRSRIDPAGLGEALALGFFYLWLGLAMSGPIVLLLDRRGAEPPNTWASSHPPSRYTGDEMAWLAIGGYFIALTLFVVPARHRETPWSLVLLIQAVVAAGLLVWLPLDRRRRSAPGPSPPRWTRRAAGLVLLTWPVAWLALILLLR